MSTVRATTVHTVEYEHEGKRETAGPNQHITLDADSAERLVSVGAIVIDVPTVPVENVAVVERRPAPPFKRGR